MKVLLRQLDGKKPIGEPITEDYVEVVKWLRSTVDICAGNFEITGHEVWSPDGEVWYVVVAFEKESD